MQKCVIIHNPYSGNQRSIKNIKLKLIHIAYKCNYILEFIETNYKGEAIEIVKELDNSYSLVISMGGDGTFNEVAAGNFYRKKKLLLSHLPTGTTNDLKYSFGLTGSIDNMFESILCGRNVSYDILTINNTPFTYVAGVGLLLDVSYSTAKADKAKLGYKAYLLDACKSIIKDKIPLYDIEYETRKGKHHIRTPLVLISNSGKFAGFKFYNRVKVNDGKFEVMMPKTNNIIKIALGILRIRTFGKSKNFNLIKTNKITILVNSKTKNWCIDGEMLNGNTNKYLVKVSSKINCRIPNKSNSFI